MLSHRIIGKVWRSDVKEKAILKGQPFLKIQPKNNNV